MPESERSEHSLAVFIDFENLALGFQGRRDRFDINRVLKRLVDKGKIVAKKAYADWNRYSSYTIALHEAAIELIEIPHRNQSGKNSADIHLCVDAMDLGYSKEHIDTFVIVSGDSDFSPLVSKLKELGKHTIGLGMQGSTSELLRDNCDEFIYYEDLGDSIGEWKEIDPTLPEQKRKAFALLLDACLALRRENRQDLMSSVVKDTMKRKKPSFNETYHGYRTFSALLEDAQRAGLVEIETNPRSGTYVVTRFGEELKQGPARRPQRGGEERQRPRTRTGTSRGRRDDLEQAGRRRRIPNVEGDAPPPLPRTHVRSAPLDFDEADEPVRPRFGVRRPEPEPGTAEPPRRRPPAAPLSSPPPRHRLEEPAAVEPTPERPRRRPEPLQEASELPPPPPERVVRRHFAPDEPAAERTVERPARTVPAPVAAPAPQATEPPPPPPKPFGAGILD